MKQIKTYIFILFTLTLSSCVTVEPLPNVTIAKGAKIGFISLVDETPKIAHSGTTVFNNASYPRTEQWDLSNRLFESLKTDLSSQGFDLVRLEASSMLKLKRTALISAGWSSFHISNIVSREIENYGKTENIDAVIIFSPYMHDGVGGADGAINGYGLFRSCAFDSCRFEPLERVRTIVATTNSPKLVGWDNYKPKPKALNITYDGDLKDLPAEIFNTAKEPVWLSVKSDANIALKDAGLIHSGNSKKSNK